MAKIQQEWLKITKNSRKMNEKYEITFKKWSKMTKNWPKSPKIKKKFPKNGQIPPKINKIF